MPIPITDDRIAQLIHNDPLAYRWYTLACRNGLTEQQFLAELLLAKCKPPVDYASASYEDCKREADTFAERYGLAEVR